MLLETELTHVRKIDQACLVVMIGVLEMLSALVKDQLSHWISSYMSPDQAQMGNLMRHPHDFGKGVTNQHMDRRRDAHIQMRWCILCCSSWHPYNKQLVAWVTRLQGSERGCPTRPSIVLLEASFRCLLEASATMGWAHFWPLDRKADF